MLNNVMLNNVILMGRLTKDIELRQTQTGTSVCSFTVAVDSGYGDDKKTDFINSVAWKGTAEFLAKYFGKGQMVALVGRISTRTWNGEDGKKNYVTEVVAREVSFCGSKNEGNNASSSTPTYAPIPADYEEIDSDEDLPF